MESIKKLKSLFSEEIEFFNKNALNANFTNPIYQQIVFHIINEKSKKIRFLMLLIIGKIINCDSEVLKLSACAIEFVHNATLLHDDIVDESNFRHGIETAHTVWGVKITILIGDYLFAQALNLAAQTKNNEIVSTVANATQNLIDGEVKILSTNKVLV